MPMSDAEFESAVARAGALLRASRAPVIAGLGADVAGIVAAFRLARKLGAAIDHAGAECGASRSGRAAGCRADAGEPRRGAPARRHAPPRRRSPARGVAGAAGISLLRETASPAEGRGAGRAARPIGTGRRRDHGCAQTPVRASRAFSPRSGRASTAGRWRATSIAPPRSEKRPMLLKAAAFGVALWSPDEHRRARDRDARRPDQGSERRDALVGPFRLRRCERDSRRDGIRAG